MNNRDSEDDVFARDDAIFVEAFVFAWRHLEDGRPIDEHAEAAVQDMINLAMDHGDRMMWALIFRIFDAYVSSGRSPPMAMLAGLNRCFRRWPAESLDDAFELTHPRKGRPSSMIGRLQARLRARAVEELRDTGLSLEEAIGKACESHALGCVSESQIKRDYLRYRRIK